jgi:maltoporin
VIGKQWQNGSYFSAAWSTAGTGGTTAGTNFIGTTDANDFVVKTNNSEALRITSAGNTGLGVTAPSAYLHIKGPRPQEPLP